MTDYTSRATIARCEASRMEPRDLPVLGECAGCGGDLGPNDIVHIYRINRRQVVIHEDVTCLTDYLASLSPEYDHGTAGERLLHNVWQDMDERI